MRVKSYKFHNPGNEVTGEVLVEYHEAETIEASILLIIGFVTYVYVYVLLRVSF